MSDKMIEIAKECGAEIVIDIYESSEPDLIAFSEQNLHAYTEKVCKQMVEALNEAQNQIAAGEEGHKAFYKIKQALAAHKEMMGDRHE